MENREENLKKINEELEKLDDEQLEQVAGGILIDVNIRDKCSAVAANNQNQNNNPMLGSWI